MTLRCTLGIKVPFITLLLGIGAFSCSDDEDITLGIRDEMLDKINRLRSEGCTCGSDKMPPVPTVKWNKYLETASQVHVNDMYTNNYFSHISPEGSSPAQRAMEAGYDGLAVGENIARGYQTVEGAIKGWIDSEPHCKAMMNGLYAEIGASRQEDYWVLDLGTPAPD